MCPFAIPSAPPCQKQAASDTALYFCRGKCKLDPINYLWKYYLKEK